MPNELTPEQIKDRLDVAYDALQQLRAGKYLACCQVYVESPDAFEKALATSSLEAQIQPLLLEHNPTCTVCARGALLLSTIRQRNDLKVGQISPGATCGAFSRLYDREPPSERSVFDPHSLHLMESAFEGWSPSYDDEDDKYSSDWMCNYATDHDRLEAILCNVIKHNGVFDFNDVNYYSGEIKTPSLGQSAQPF